MRVGGVEADLGLSGVDLGLPSGVVVELSRWLARSPEILSPDILFSLFGGIYS